MNRILLIGNGFDRAHNLKTGYEQFVCWLWEKEKEKLNNKNNWTPYNESKHGKINNGNLTIPELEANFHIYKDKFISFPIQNEALEEVDYSFENYVKSKLKNNICNFFLEQIDKQKTLINWVDIENEYYKALRTIIDPNFSIQIYNKTFRYNDIDKLNEWFQQIKIELEKYFKEKILIEKTEKISDLEKFIYSNFSINDFTKKGKDNLIDIAYKKILSLKGKELSIDRLSESTVNFYNLIKPLVSEEKSILNEFLKYSLDTKEDFVKLLKKYNGYIDISTLLLPESVLFLNFNYTDTNNKYSVSEYFENKTDGWKSEFKIEEEVIHIHGELNNSMNPIIFGYGDELDENYQKILKSGDDRLLENIKSIKYGETYNYKRLLNFIESDNYQIFVLGHSCGNSDKTLLNTLFEHENCQSIKIFYYEKFNDKKEKESDDFSKIYRNITRNFTKFKDLRAKVVDKTNSQPFPQAKSK